VARFGGSRATEAAVEAGLRWLVRHQERGGFWKPDKWEAPPKASTERVTALATLALLGAGYTHKRGKFRDGVRRALTWLTGNQRAGGGIGGDVLTHALCTQALAEAYGMTKDGKLRAAAQQAVDHALKSRKAGSGWPKARPDLTSTAAILMALKSARVAGLKVPGSGFSDGLAFVGKVTDAKGHCRGLPEEKKSSPAMTARGMVSRLFTGTPNTHRSSVAGAAHLLTTLPSWGSRGKGVDLDYWHWGSLAAFQHGGAAWKKWNAGLQRVLVENQRKRGPMDGSRHDVDGSWDPLGPAGKQLGRAGATALGTLCLETYYRYLPLYGALKGGGSR
jgi:hypothetical protein